MLDVKLFGFLNRFHLFSHIVHSKYLFDGLSELPKLSSPECQNLCAHFRPLHFEPFVFLYVDFPHHCPYEWVMQYLLSHLYLQKRVIVFVVFECKPIPHQKKFIGQSAIAKENLCTLFKLVFGGTQHIKLIKFVLLPSLGEIVLPFGGLICDFFGLGFLFLLDSVVIVFFVNFVVKLFHFLDVLHIGWVHHFAYLFPTLPTFNVYCF